MTMGEMHMKLGQNIGKILLDISQIAIQKLSKVWPSYESEQDKHV